MAQEQQAINIADIPALQAVAEEVVRTRKRQKLPVDGQEVTIIVEPSAHRRSLARKHATRSADSFLTSYQAIPPLSRSLSVEEMTEIAAEEHAQEAASQGR